MTCLLLSSFNRSPFTYVAKMDELIQTLNQNLPDKVFLHGHPEYAESLSSYFSIQESQIQPACIVRPAFTQHVSSTLSAIAEVNRNHGTGAVKFAVRSGGLAPFAGAANEPNGVTIDLRGMKKIEMNESRTQVQIGAGASWGEVYRTLDPLGLAVPGGRHSQLGVSGLTLGGEATKRCLSFCFILRFSRVLP